MSQCRYISARTKLERRWSKARGSMRRQYGVEEEEDKEEGRESVELDEDKRAMTS